MHIGMRIHTTNNPRYHQHDRPFHSLKAERVAHATGTAERDPTEPALSAQPDPHRPTGACNTTHIIANQHTQPDMGGLPGSRCSTVPLRCRCGASGCEWA
jgi:hypothetical protein